MEKGLKKLAVFFGLVLCISCSQDSAPLSELEFAEFYADVAKAQLSAPDTAAAIDSALLVAERYDVSKEDLVRFRRVLEKDPGKWVFVWEHVVDQLKE